MSMETHGAILLGNSEGDELEPAPLDPVSGLSLEMQAGFTLLAGRLDGIEEKERRRELQTPVHHRAVGSALSSSSGFAVIDVGGPPTGHMWYILALTVGGLSPVVAAAGRGDVYVSTVDLRAYSSLAAAGLADWRDYSTGLPTVSFYDPGQIMLRGLEHLYVIISQGTASQEYVAAATITDFQEGAVIQTEPR